MGKFTAAEDDIFSLFGAPEWKAEGVETIPVNYETPAGYSNDYIRVNIIASGKGVNRVSVSGMLIIDIFTSAGKGPRAATLIADKLEQFLACKTFQTGTGTTQLQTGSFTPKGKDGANPLLFLSSYSIPFNYFGV